MAEKYLVTGGAGFIGSNVVASLNAAGRTDIALNDVLGTDGKWRNLGKRQVADFVPPAELWRWLEGRRLEAVIHLGAISDTTATDADLVIEKGDTGANRWLRDGDILYVPTTRIANWNEFLRDIRPTIDMATLPFRYFRFFDLFFEE